MALLNAELAAHAIVNAWDNWTDETALAESICDDQQAAAAYARVLVEKATHQIPEPARIHFANAVAVITTDPTSDAPLPNLSFDEAIAPLRVFILGGYR